MSGSVDESHCVVVNGILDIAFPEEAIPLAFEEFGGLVQFRMSGACHGCTIDNVKS